LAIRVLHCPTDVGGNAYVLSRAERQLGIESDVLVFSSTWLQYPSDIDLQVPSRSTAGKALALARTLAKAARDYDIIHFNFGQSLTSRLPSPLSWLRGMDLPWLKSRGKGIVVTYQGCDVRQRGYSISTFPISACAEPDCYGGVCNSKVDARRQADARRFDRYADAMFALNPDLLNVLPDRARFLPYTTVDTDEWRPSGSPRPEGGSFKILHAPTDTGAKGTRYVLEAVDELRKSHPEIELLLVEGVPHTQVRKLYEKADLVIDQLLVGWYGGLAVEAMALGKPVVSYIRESDLRFVPPQMRAELPIINANPQTLVAVLEGVMANRSDLPGRGVLCRAFVERWHDPVEVAEMTKATYEQILRLRA
jgi:glycosyltransferase involved in cell wall biosynthesis